MLSKKNSPKWIKKGRIFTREGGDFFKTHAMRVVPFLKQDGVLRLFFSSRCKGDMMHPTYIDVNPENPSEILEVNESPLMSLGPMGCFDDSGITLASIASFNGRHLFYYTGWKRRRYGVPFELAIGVAELLEDGRKLVKLFDGPIISQDIAHPYLVGGPFVLREANGFRMWYCSGTSWANYDSGMEPIYSVFYGESQDGIYWRPMSNSPVIQYRTEGEVISAPWVNKTSDGYIMYYPFRQSQSAILKRYSIGLAISDDGISWRRMDECSGIGRSEYGWDSEMICYPALFKYKNKEYLFYSGNGVGLGGFGYAEAVE